MVEEHAIEPIRGLPESLPQGESILWQGEPDWWSLSRRVFHVVKVAAYFLLLTIWRGIGAAADGQPVLASLPGPILLGLLAVGLFMLAGFLVSRTTVYTVTNRRVVMRYGIALPINLNLPFRQIRSAQLKAYRDGTGDVPLEIDGDDRISYLVLWPHARPWHLKRPQPMLRALPGADAAADILATALQAFHAGSPLRAGHASQAVASNASAASSSLQASTR